MQNNVSRRSFVKGAGTAAGIAAASALASTAMAAAADDIQWTAEADVVVLGYGIAGMSAAKTAAIDEGQDVIVLDKAPFERAGGATRVNGGTFGMQSANAYIKGSFGAIDQELCDNMAAASEVFVNWLFDECGVKVNGMFLDGYGKAMWEKAHAVLSTIPNIDIRFETRGVKCVKGANGEVHGVIAEGPDGETQYYKARKGVIVCTGSYVGNKSLVWGSHYPFLPYEICTSPECDGDGVYLIADAGGAVMKDTSLALEFFGWAMEPASREVGTAMLQDDANWRVNTFAHARIFVNKNGKRFMDEGFADTHDKSSHKFLDYKGTPSNAYAGGAGNGYLNLPMWGVYDAKILAQGSLWMAPEWSPAHTYGVGSWSQDNMAEVEKGWILKADTLEELAALMVSADPITGEPVSVDPAGLAATVEEYNTVICAAGVDPCGKNPDYLIPLDTPPYYAIELVPALGYTNSGVPTNNESQVLTWGGETVPRLYAAGDVGQGMRTMMLTMRGCGARATLGAEAICALEPWE